MITNTGATKVLAVLGGGGLSLVLVDLGGSVIPELSPTFIPDPPANHDANTTAAALVNDPISVWTPTANRKLDPRDAPNSMGLTIIKDNALAFSLTIDVTSGAPAGWTTPAGLNTDYVLLNSGAAATGSWLLRIDKVRKIVTVTPI